MASGKVKKKCVKCGRSFRVRIEINGDTCERCR
jgi:hypothetical protein